ncbi:NADPH-dependent FMN reductase [Rhizodiscina lignyota]|uniref:NADPH-dependent FMN reductase n=1 Tax=Rhizodiscina lignyota TaxID=1504668 RepID=A0A9P4ICP2_9PEZI|nr:NADPH-dependent FMN reductase [Rhizodiscina lignyota]
MATPKVAVVIFSVRSPRVGPNVAAYVKSIIDTHSSSIPLEYNTVDVVDFKLPVFNESLPPATVPAMGPHKHETTKAWSAEISKYAGYVLVSPEYNYGMPGPTKNAIDYLYNEWAGKPALIVTYGVKGGTFASEQLKGVLEGMKLNVCSTKPALPFLGGQGPDAMAAMSEGKLGDDTKNSWDKEQKTVILEGLKELEEKIAAGKDEAKPQ